MKKDNKDNETLQSTITNLQTELSKQQKANEEISKTYALKEQLAKSGVLDADYQKGTGIGSNFAKLDTRKIDKVLTTPWAADGKNFSDRIWNNKERMVKELHRELTQSIIRADDPQKAINNLTKILNANKKNVGRLVMTEMAAVSSLAQKDCFKELDVEEFEIVATLDSLTSEICREMDGKHFPMSQYEIGVTAPPFHVRCRTVTVPYFDDDFGVVGQRAARGEDGKTYYVPADMTYREWKESFVGSNQAKDRFEIFTNNNKSNKKYYDFKGKTLSQVEKEISQFDYEVAVIFGKDGKAVIAQLGNEDTVEFNNYQLHKMKGCDITHNHPLSTPPSPEDLYLLAYNKANTLRTCGKNGVYVLEYNKAVQNLPKFEEFNIRYVELLNELSPKYKERIKNELGENVALIQLGEEIWNELYNEYGVKPKFKEW